MSTIALPLGTLLWTPTTPRPVETLQAGDTLIGFSPDTFARVTVGLERVRVETNVAACRLQAGGRMIEIAEASRCPVFDLTGRWRGCAAAMLQTGDFIPVDRVTPVPDAFTALPPLDADLTARLDEDALTLSDALYDSAAYFHEMDKRALRLTLYELCGYLCGVAVPQGDSVHLPSHDPVLTAHYDESLRSLFGATPAEDAELWGRMRHFLGDGLAPLPQRALPVWVWALPNPACSAFLRGFFDCTSDVTERAITVTHPSLALLVGIQTLLGRVHLESTLDASADGITLTIRNLRRFAEWISSNVAAHAGVLRAIYSREPRYPSDSTAHLPMNVIRPALERIRNRHALPRRSTDTVDEREATRIETLRLLATAFHDADLRDVVNQQLYLEPVTAIQPVSLDMLFILSLSSPATVIANGVVVGGMASEG
jgi:hypothetical protein